MIPGGLPPVGEQLVGSILKTIVGSWGQPGGERWPFSYVVM